MVPAQRIVRHPKMARGEQVLVIHVVGEGARLADQRVDDVPVVDRVFPGTGQPRHALDQDARVPHLHFLDADHDVHLLPNQAAGDGIGVPQHLDRAPRAHGDIGQPPSAFQPPRWERADRHQLFQKPLLSLRIPRSHQLAQELGVCRPVGKVPAATQSQGLVHSVLEVTVRRFHVAVLVRLADIDPLPLQIVVIQQVAIALTELPLVRKVVHGRRETVTAMPTRNASKFPQGVLQALAQRLERLRGADRERFPIGVRQREVIDQMGKWLAAERHAQGVHVREVGSRQVAGMVDLGEQDLLVRPLRSPPRADLSLERAPLAVGELLPLGLVLKPAKQRDGS